MKRALVSALGITLLAVVSGCGRHVVLAPEDVARSNDRAWRVTSEPNKAAPATPPSAPPSR